MGFNSFLSENGGIIGVSSFVVAIVSIVIAFFQYRRSLKAKKLMTNETLGINKLAGLALGASQLIKEDLNNKNYDDAFYQVGRAVAFSDSILYESARLYCNLGNKSKDDIEREVSENKLYGDYINIYLSFVRKKKRKLTDE